MKINNQIISKTNYDPMGRLSIVNMFLTIQGEGPLVGSPAVFIRLYGCNLRCPYCDTDYTSKRITVDPKYIVKEVDKLATAGQLVVISGGEPFRQNLTPTVELLLANGYEVQIETNGTLFIEDLPYDEITVVCSPKTGLINKKLLPHIAALKYVIHADMIDADGLPTKALNHSANPVVAKPPTAFSGIVYVQPIDVEDELENTRHLDAAIRICLKHNYRLCLQVHKIINME